MTSENLSALEPPLSVVTLRLEASIIAGDISWYSDDLESLGSILTRMHQSHAVEITVEADQAAWIILLWSEIVREGITLPGA